jgi:thiol-disulfide isomerase/thioredoxin
MNKILKPFTQRAFWQSLLQTLLLVGVISFVISSYQQRHMVSGMAPALPGFDWQNRQNKGPVLVYFWGSWCGVCRAVSPGVSTLAESAHYEVISVALSSGSDDQIRQYQQKHDYHFATINDDSGHISERWGVKVTPSLFIIDAKGEISFTTTGISSAWGLRIRLWLASF